MHMKKMALAVLFVTSSMGTLSAGPATLTGTYVEARTSEIFAGACVINGEAATAGREALLAWKVDSGRFNGVSLDGLAVVAAVVGRREPERAGDRRRRGEHPRRPVRRRARDRAPAPCAGRHGQSPRRPGRRRPLPK